ncbi:MAG: pyruvate dehydrogenase complex dihydrolipoamide acetyltransferase [Paracoccaceae bacterium]|nr:pyruvate dehydrogenase complex dihydrolipoamide acetyltransferase [Paracoccaceae bacterium]
MPIEILMPALSPTMEEGTLAKWLVKEGDLVTSGDVIAEIETDKATMEVEAVDEGVLSKILVAECTEGVKINAAIAILLEEGEDPDAVLAAPTPTSALQEENAEAPLIRAAPSTILDTSNISDRNRIFASPLARRIASQKGLDLNQITGSGPHGRIVKADVEKAQASPTKTIAPEAIDSPVASSATASEGIEAEQIKKIYTGREFDEVPLDNMRKTIAARLTMAKQTIPHFYLRRDFELDELLAFRGNLNKKLEPKGVKLSVNDFVIKACALALRDVPNCNAAWANDRILNFSAVDIAVAVAIDGGLITPVLRDSETKTISSLSAEMKDLAGRARDRKLAPHEYQGGSFSISNLGMMGIDNFDAVINPPHGAILAVGAGVKKPVVKVDQIQIATVMSVTLSVDHRVIDGALGAELLAAIKGYIEEPMTMLV